MSDAPENLSATTIAEIETAHAAGKDVEITPAGEVIVRDPSASSASPALPPDQIRAFFVSAAVKDSDKRDDLAMFFDEGMAKQHATRLQGRRLGITVEERGVPVEQIHAAHVAILSPTQRDLRTQRLGDAIRWQEKLGSIGKEGG
jgi:hypothetical protein